MKYSYNHNCPFEAYITNLGKYNEGELIGEWVKFPTTQENLKEVFQRIGIGEQNQFGNIYEKWFITDYDCYVNGFYDILGEYENIDELNYLAAKIEEMEEWEFDRFEAAIETGEYINSVKELINLTDNLDCYDFIKNINNYSDLGYYYVHEAGIYDLEIMGQLANYIDYEAFGRDIAIEESGTFTEHGYMASNKDSFDEYYDGEKDNIPEEYQVMDFLEELGISYE